MDAGKELRFQLKNNPDWLKVAQTSDPYQLIFETHPQPMWLIDADTLKFEAVNDAAVERYGYSRQEFLEMNLYDIRPAEDVPVLKNYCDQSKDNPVLATQGVCDVWRHKLKDGTLIEVEIRWRPIVQGEKISILSLVTELTDSKRADAQMKLQANALSQVTEAVFAVNNSRKITYWNKAAENLYGYSAKEVLGHSVEDIVRYEYLCDEHESAAKLSMKEIGSWRGEKLHRKKNGLFIYVDASMSTLTNREQAVIGILTVSRDITEAKTVQKALVESNETLSAIINSSPVAIVVSDNEGKVKTWNHAAHKMFGWSADEMTAQPFHRLVPKSAKADYCSVRERVLEGESFSGVETERLCKDGSVLDIITSAAPVHDIDGKVIGIISLLMDITERKRSETELRIAKEAADAANRTKTEFVANISHEIRTPLSAILGFAEMMFDSKQTVGERMNCIARIRHNVKNLTALIEDLLDLSKVEAGKFEVAPTDFLLLPELSEVSTLLQSQIVRKGLGLRILFEGPIPKTITSDPTRLRQILINVMGNAIKFTDRGTITLKVFLDQSTGEKDTARLVFEIIDTGPGISTDQVDSIFEPFAQIDSSSTRRFGGTGLGLNLSRQLARILGGDVVLQGSIPGKGSTFRVIIDAGNLDGVSMLEGITQNSLSSKLLKPMTYGDTNLSGMRVLLVEDGQDNRFLISHFLRTSGADVESALNGLEGAEMAQNSNYDLILMDIQMPILDGYQATQRLRDEGLETPIVALTAHAMKGEKERCYQVGCNGYLSKPIDAKTLVEVVSHYRPETAPRPSLH